MIVQFPPFNDARGETASMQLVPPFAFTGVTMRVFPLRANRYLLQRFIDQQLNIIPPAAGHFSVFLPYIYLIIVNYGKMAVEAANLGWISQNEVAFSVPLIWRFERDGKPAQEIAYVSPFIYVDNPLSMTTGREVYGWPKMMASFDPSLSSWMANPTHRIQQASMSVDVVAEAYRGGQSERRTLLEVDSAAFPGFAELPFDVGNPLLPWNVAAQTMATGAGLLSDSVQMFRTMVEQFLLGPGRELTADQVRRVVEDPSRLAILNTVNLKQFRDAERPELIAYQAVTNTQMTMKAFRRGGMLGDLRTLGGDVTGGYRVRLHNYDTQPIIGTLGLQVASESEIDGADVSTLNPVYPFWLELDLDYPLAQILAWRQRGSQRWFYGDSHSQADADERFDTARGAGGAEIAGPYQYPDATVRVLPLLADPGRLQEFIDAYLNETIAATPTRFEVWGRYVYLVALTDEAAFSESNNVGNNATRQLEIMVPVKRYTVTADGRELLGTALVPVYAYANSATAAISFSSVDGIPTMTCELDSPPNAWLDRRGPSPVAPDQLMNLRGMVLPVLNLGQQATTRTIIECDNIEPVEWDDVQGWRRLGDRWAPLLRREHQRKREVDADRLRDAKTLALELLANGAAFNTVTLKQFRNAADPRLACYQALVEIPTRIEQLFELEEIEGSFHVRIHEYPSQAIVSSLGLVVKDWQRGGGSQIAVLEPCRPFWLRARMRQELGTNLHVWTPNPSDETRWSPAPDQTTLLQAPRLGPSLVDEIEDGTPQYLAGHVERWLDSGAPTLAPERAVAAVDAVEPQQVIESVLSCEWETWLDPRWWRGHEQILARVTAANAGAYPSEITANTGKVLRELSELVRDREQRAFGFAARRFRELDDELQAYESLAALLADVQQAEEQLRVLVAGAGPAADDEAPTSSPMAVSFSVGSQPQSDPLDAARARQREAEATLLRHLDAFRRGGEPPVGGPRQIMQEVAEQLGAMPSFSVGGAAEAPPPPPPPVLDAIRDALDRVLGVEHRSDAPLPEELRQRLIAELKQGLQLLRDRIVRKLAKSWQRPDHCIRRKTILRDGVEQEFPLRESFDGNWYVGD